MRILAISKSNVIGSFASLKKRNPWCGRAETGYETALYLIANITKEREINLQLIDYMNEAK